MTEAERDLEQARASELSALELAAALTARVRFLEQRLDEVTRDLIDARRVIAALTLSGPIAIARASFELVDAEPVLRTWTDPATGNLIIASP